MKLIEEYLTYETLSLGGNSPKEAQLLKRILSEAVALILSEGVYSTREEVQQLIKSADLLHLKAAVQALLGKTAIAVTAKPESWDEILKQAENHPLCSGWSDRDEPRNNPWNTDAGVRLIWHVEAGLICATQKSTPKAHAEVVLQGSRTRIFPWTKKNLMIESA